MIISLLIKLEQTQNKANKKQLRCQGLKRMLLDLQNSTSACKVSRVMVLFSNCHQIMVMVTMLPMQQ